ncbi:MAG: hypothetical protein IJ438_12855, partial [Clostridia bacterium]|nr:hypothetical protein [Clostridia bacterium]
MRKFWLTLGLVLTMLLVVTAAGAEECTEHIPGFAYPYSSTEHEIYCFVENCNAVVGYEQHYNACNDSSSGCDGCGAVDVVIGFDTHGSITYVNLGEEHQAKCEDCGMLGETVRHERAGYQ